ncbi:MAG: alpha/beta hydrolase [Firmicutes bacterium]|nr:alpha/beta hydrolase [Bacillota bacterium]
MSHYHLLDQPIILRYAFSPSSEMSDCPEYAFDLSILVEENVYVSCRFFMADLNYPSILYFHGNGEVASDYDEIAPFYFNLANANLIVAEFRGYGASSGIPTFAGLISDALPILKGVSEQLSNFKFRKDIWVMGRSMGSVPALELASNHPEKIKGLIIESGFPCASRIVRRLQIPMAEADLKLIEDECLEKIRRITLPALIIHGEQDSLVSVQEAYTLEKELGSADKRLLIIPGADHNTVMAEDIDGYFQAIREFISSGK